MNRTTCALGVFLVVAAAARGAIDPPKPGWNLFSAGQDVKLGKEAQAEVERKMHVVHNSELTRYLTAIGQKLARSEYAGKWPYTFGLVADPNINAFRCPADPSM